LNIDSSCSNESRVTGDGVGSDELGVGGDEIPRCDGCATGIVKPDITFFGEQLPARFHAMCAADLAHADALIVIGTSLKVQPFASLVGRVRAKVCFLPPSSCY
jgi:NAD-dependent SIR2 family protein deacetylase